MDSLPIIISIGSLIILYFLIEAKIEKAKREIIEKLNQLTQKKEEKSKDE